MFQYYVKIIYLQLVIHFLRIKKACRSVECHWKPPSAWYGCRVFTLWQTTILHIIVTQLHSRESKQHWIANWKITDYINLALKAIDCSFVPLETLGVTWTSIKYKLWKLVEKSRMIVSLICLTHNRNSRILSLLGWWGYLEDAINLYNNVRCQFFI